MPNAIRVHEYGGPEVLTWEPVTIPAPGPGQARIRHTAVGLNYIDVYQRTGLYKTPLPFILGQEGAGIVESIGPGVYDLKEGDRVAYAGAMGGYSEVRLIDADRVVKLPEEIDDYTAAAMMLQGMTAQYLIRRTFPVQEGDTILLHAAAGGVGLILSQWASALGAIVIGTVSNREKAALAQAHGCAHTIIYGQEDVAKKVKELTNGVGVPVVYDSVGKDTFEASLNSLAPLGTMVTFGQSSGSIAPFDVGILSAKGSLFLTRPTLGTYIAKRQDLVDTAEDLFEAVTSGTVRINVNQTFPLSETADAHRALEARQTTGSTVLTV